jgi:hypothetical protein
MWIAGADMRLKLFVSVSGGETSGYMAKRLRDEYSDDYDMRFGFANTGLEKLATLAFVERMHTEWEMPITWLEAVTHFGERAGCTHKIVDFATASRNGEPFEEMIKKYGVPNKKYPHCTRELKLNPIRSYLESIGWQDCFRAVGIRMDEPRRIREDADSERIIYPLVSMFPSDKPMIKDWWEFQPFQLGLKDYEGNCEACWKKSDTKLIRIAKENPSAFDFPARMEATYGTYADGKPRTFFRGRRSAKDIISMAQLLNPPPYAERPDENSGCSESCEAF